MSNRAEDRFNMLRQRAEQALNTRRKTIDDMASGETKHLLHELQVHQVELELQHEDLRRAYSDLEKSRDQFADLYDYAPIAYLTLNTDGLIVEANLTVAQWFGVPREELIARRLSNFIMPDSQDTLYLHLRGLFTEEDRQPDNPSVRLRTPDGPGPIVRLDSLLRKGPNDARRVRMEMIDITEQRYAEEMLIRHQSELERRIEERTADLQSLNGVLQSSEQQLRQAVQKEAAAREIAERTSQIMTQFLAMISHELRTPLASIKGSTSSLLATDVDLSSRDTQEFLRILDEEADRLGNLVGELLDVFGAQKPVFEVHASETYLQDIMTQVVHDLRVLATLHRLEIKLPETLPLVRADSQRTGQVIINLVENAVKYSRPGTLISIAAHVEGDFVQVDVSDQGEGIAPEEHNSIFEPFHRTNTGNKTIGIGLGLAICKGLIEAQGGKIWVNTRTRPGATISFTLPIMSLS